MAAGDYYRVLQGRHSEGVDKQGNPLVYYKGGPHGDVVKSKSDLDKMNGVGVQPKFENLGPDYKPRKVLQEEWRQGEGDNPVTITNDPPDLENMTVPQLKEFAEDNEIDITGLTLKEQIMGKIADVLAK